MQLQRQRLTAFRGKPPEISVEKLTGNDWKNFDRERLWLTIGGVVFAAAMWGLFVLFLKLQGWTGMLRWGCGIIGFVVSGIILYSLFFDRKWFKDDDEEQKVAASVVVEGIKTKTAEEIKEQARKKNLKEEEKTEENRNEPEFEFKNPDFLKTFALQTDETERQKMVQELASSLRKPEFYKNFDNNQPVVFKGFKHKGKTMTFEQQRATRTDREKALSKARGKPIQLQFEKNGKVETVDIPTGWTDAGIVLKDDKNGTVEALKEITFFDGWRAALGRYLNRLRKKEKPQSLEKLHRKVNKAFVNGRKKRLRPAREKNKFWGKEG